LFTVLTAISCHYFLDTEDWEVRSARLPEAFDGLRVTMVCDVHGARFGNGSRRLLQAVTDSRPDLIAICGDLADEVTDRTMLDPLLQGLCAIAPCYYVTGNHEWGAHKAKETLSYFREWGVTCLENEYVPIERDGARIFLAGIHDPNGYADQKTPSALARELYAAEGDPYWLLLAHRSNRFDGEYCRLGANLTLSGHAHGGIWRLPFTDGLFSTNLTLFPSFTSGFYTCTGADCEDETVFVSRGLGNSPRYLPRVMNPPQVAVITLTKEAVQ
jgi:predicted MPP superfamily phosphohydrolase